MPVIASILQRTALQWAYITMSCTVRHQLHRVSLQPAHENLLCEHRKESDNHQVSNKRVMHSSSWCDMGAAIPSGRQHAPALEASCTGIYRVFGGLRRFQGDRLPLRRWVRWNDKEVKRDQGGVFHGSYSTLRSYAYLWISQGSLRIDPASKRPENDNLSILMRRCSRTSQYFATEAIAASV